MSIESKIKIYGLFDVRFPNEIRYIGKTKQKVSKRVKDHIRDSIKLITSKDKWIIDTINSGGAISYVIIEEVNEFNWDERERYWIKFYPNLTNTSSGGQGGRGIIHKISYEELKKWVVKNAYHISNANEWFKFVKNNKNLPFNPKEIYKNRGWISWDDFLPNYKRFLNKRPNYGNFFNYNEAKKYVKKLGIKSFRDWKKYIKSNKISDRMPSAPYIVYKKTKEWKGWGEFLGTNAIHNKDKIFMNYEDTKIIVKKLNLKNYGDWENYIKVNGLIDGIPRHPQRFYKKTNDWVSWDDFLN